MSHKQNRSQSNITKPERKVEIHALAHSGPIPDPKTLVGYENILKGSADRIITMAEKQQNHRISIEKSVVDSKIRDSKLGLILGFILSLVIFIIAGLSIALNKDLVGLSLIISNSVALIGIFVHTNKLNRKERSEGRNINS